jgi:ABC-2 type transport system permease protein
VNGFSVLLRKEITEQWRTGRLPVVTVLFFLLGLTSPVLAKYTPELVKLAAGLTIPVPTPTTKDAVAQLIKNLSQFGLLTAVLLAMGSVAGEMERGTAAFVLSKPVSRAAFLAAKLTGLAFTLATAVLICGLAAYVYTLLLFEALSPLAFAAGCAVLLLVLLEFAALTFLGSVVAGSAVPAASFGLIGLVVAGVLSAIPVAGRLTPFGLNDLAGQIVLSSLGTDWILPIAANIALVCAIVALSWLAFRRREL